MKRTAKTLLDGTFACLFFSPSVTVLYSALFFMTTYFSKPARFFFSYRRSRSRSPRRDAPDHSSAPPKRRRFSERQGDASADAYSPEGAFAGAPGGAGGSPPAEESDSLAKMEWFASQADKSQQRDYVPTPEEDKPGACSLAACARPLFFIA